MDFFNSPEDLQSVALVAVRHAVKQGGNAAEAEAAESSSLSVQTRGGQFDGCERGRAQGISVTVYFNGGEGTASVGDMTADAARLAAEKALAIARKSAADPHAGLADKELMAQDFPDLSLYHPHEWSVDAAYRMARECEESARAADDSIARDKTEAEISMDAARSVYCNSHGFAAPETETAYSASCGAIAERDGIMETEGWSETRRCHDWLPSMAEIGDKAGRYAARRLGVRKIKSGRMNVLFLPPASHSLFGHIVGAASGSSLYHKTSWLAGRLGETICAPHISIREDPHVLGGLRSTAFDDDGVATRPRMVVDKGVWRGCFLSAYSARRLGMQTTGNAGGAYNLFVDGDLRPLPDLLKETGAGLAVTSLMGQGVNRVTGDYSRGAAGFWVENGEYVHPVSEVTIAGNLRQMLPAIAALGDDVLQRGLFKCGAVLIPDLMVGGS